MSGEQWSPGGYSIGAVTAAVILAAIAALSSADKATFRSRIGLGQSSAPDGGVLVAAGGTVAWATPSGGATHGAGTLASRPASPSAGDTYVVTSGTAKGDVYACDVAGTWRLTSYDRTPAYLAPTVLWLASETSGTTLASTGSNTSPSLTISGSSVVGVQGERATAWASLASGDRAVSGDGAFVPSSTRRLTISVAIQSISGTTLNTPVFGFRSSTGPRRQMIFVDGNGLVSAWVATPTSETTLSSHTSAIDALIRTGSQTLAHLVWDGDDGTAKVRLYADGRLIATSNPSDTDLTYGSAGQYWTAGALVGFSGGVQGKYSHLAAWDGVALTAAQVREHNARFHGTYTGQ